MVRWLEILAEYDFEIVHQAWKNYSNADGLTRIFSTLATVIDDKQWITPSLQTEFSNQQNNDAVTSPLIKWLNKAERPDDDEIKGTFRELRYYWARLKELLMKNGILGLLNNSVDGVTTYFRAIITKRARQKILKLAHISVGGGHFKVQKTVTKSTSNVFNGIVLHETSATGVKMPDVQSPHNATTKPRSDATNLHLRIVRACGDEHY